MPERTRLLFEANGSGPAGLAVPFVRQTTDYSCGAAALLAVLRYWRPGSVTTANDRHLFGALKTSAKSGTSAARLVGAAREYGLRAELLHGASLSDVQRRVARGQTVIVNFQAWPKSGVMSRGRPQDGHFAVLVGIDRSRAYLMDPWIINRYGHVAVNELLRSWVDNARNKQLAVAIWGDGPPRTKRLGVTRRIQTTPYIT